MRRYDLNHIDPMKKRILLFALAIPLIAAPILLVVASASSGPSLLRIASPESTSPTADDAVPRVFVQESEYDFGVMDPLQSASHAFVIRNQGDGPLRLRRGSTTCKCTLSEVDTRLIPPGGSGEVVLTWNTGRKHQRYDHSATVLTNDPERPELQLHVRGVVRADLRAEPETLVLMRVEPNQPSRVSGLVYTQLPAPFEIVHASCTLDGSSVSFEPASPAALEDLAATGGRQIHVELPTGLDSGQVDGMVQLTVRREGQETDETVEIPLVAQVLRRLAVYGPAVDETGTVDLGRLRPGQGAKHRLLLKVRDEQPEIIVRGIEVEPAFIQVKVTPYHTATSAAGLYHLDIEVPTDAPECVLLGPDAGLIRIEIDHPRIPDLSLNVQLLVKRL
ncbi:MAG: DUF1573 domain-containing protein [Pirellulaceae bacterium]|nr:DUF1573 domain-containing protein [Pirellulaceae bacterium]